MMVGSQPIQNNPGYGQPGQYSGQQPAQQQWNNFGGAPGMPAGGNENAWSQNQFYQQGGIGGAAAPYAAAQFQQQAALVLPGQQFA